MTTELIITIIVAIFGSTGFWTWLQNRQRRKSAETRLLLGIAYSKIINQCDRHIEAQEVSAQELKELTDYLYQPYHDMGGNGTVDSMMAQVRALPIRKD